MEKKTFGEFLASLRREKGLTQAELAEMMNVSDKTVSHWERGESSPDLSMLLELAEAFSVTCDELVRGERQTAEAKPNTAKKEETAEERAQKSAAAVKRGLDRLKIKTLILLGVDVAGVLFGLIVGSVFPMPVVGLAAAGIFFAAALILAVIFRASALGKSELDALSDEKKTEYRQTANFYCFISVVLTVLFVCFAWPIGHCGVYRFNNLLENMFQYLGIYGTTAAVISAIVFLILKKNGSFPRRLKSDRTEKQRKMLMLSVSVISVTAAVVTAFAVWSYVVVNTDLPTTGFERSFDNFEEFKAFMEENVSKTGEAEMTVSGQEPFEKCVVDGKEFVWRNKTVFNYFANKDDPVSPYRVVGFSDSPKRAKLLRRQSFVYGTGWTVYAAAAALALGTFGIGSRKIRQKYD